MRTTARVHVFQSPPGLLLPLLLLFATAPTGCVSKPPQLMPTPNLYAEGIVDPFIDVDPDLQNNKADVIYLTDRQPEQTTPDWTVYGFKRSRSMAFGIARVQFGGDDVSWAELVNASRTQKRSIDLAMSVKKVNEIARFLPTPRNLIEVPGSTSSKVSDAQQEAAETAFRETMAKQLSHTRVKEVYVFVHGFANAFSDGATTIAELWHFFGRQGVPVAYTWPAGSKSLRAYMYDRESSEFTVFHLKQALKLIASCPEVQKIHIIGHSRGTDVVTSALRELHLQIGGVAGDARATRAALRLGTVVLAAPDIDLDVMIQRMATARVGYVPEQTVMYVQANDKALGLANWLFLGATRAGDVKSNMFAPEEIQALRATNRPQVIEARVSNTGAFGHDYFHSNPAVSSDLILVMRYQFPPGAENSRPLGVNQGGFWLVEDRYPGVQKNKEDQPRLTAR